MVNVAKLVDAADCGSAERNLMRVRVSSFTLICGYSLKVMICPCQGCDAGSIPTIRFPVLVFACKHLDLKNWCVCLYGTVMYQKVGR